MKRDRETARQSGHAAVHQTNVGLGTDPQNITDAVCRAALRGWCNWPDDVPLSSYQEMPETTAAWRRAIAAAVREIEKQNGN